MASLRSAGAATLLQFHIYTRPERRKSRSQRSEQARENAQQNRKQRHGPIQSNLVDERKCFRQAASAEEQNTGRQSQSKQTTGNAEHEALHDRLAYHVRRRCTQSKA